MRRKESREEPRRWGKTTLGPGDGWESWEERRRQGRSWIVGRLWLGGQRAAEAGGRWGNPVDPETAERQIIRVFVFDVFRCVNNFC